MQKRGLIKVSGFVSMVEYLFIAGVLVYHLGWLDGLAISCAFSVLVGAIRTKTTWDDLVDTFENEKNEKS
jgi:hypothetical protein